MTKPDPATEQTAGRPSRLPRGRHGLPRDLVRENQRERIVAAVIETVAAKGYNATTIGAVTKAAGLSRKTFYEHFANKEDAFVGAYEDSFEFVRASMLSAAAEAEAEGWPERVRAGLAPPLLVFVSDPDLARFFLTAPAAAGDEIAAHHHEAMANLIAALTAGAPSAPSRTREQALAGGLSALVVSRLRDGEMARLQALLPDLVELVLQPYVGGAKAAAEAAKAGPS